MNEKANRLDRPLVAFAWAVPVTLIVLTVAGTAVYGLPTMRLYWATGGARVYAVAAALALAAAVTGRHLRRKAKPPRMVLVPCDEEPA